ncbi:MAG TPA: tRNA (uridine(34)/cytosine(34)/5-carboxymethylaminomethyluridine(34)-2'-O)-methyltransferase TrmL [Gammaproteobacteria bacterium]|nr:tRNA (uridine(34)/cytosine(34)/5-carboxymethylaminomethyluridine(34)-2'-O)-methyltransferase TrmL [Gammaproteobacteria bacterium]
MFHVVLYQPEIPPNTGNIIRLCANTGAQLHLIHPLGFRMDDRELKRAGLDYHEYARCSEHESLEAFLAATTPRRLFGFSTHAARPFTDVRYAAGDALLFGPETRGLPPELRARLGTESLLRIPMRARVRSLNLSNAAAIAVYEAWRQCGYAGQNEPADYSDVGPRASSV